MRNMWAVFALAMALHLPHQAQAQFRDDFNGSSLNQSVWIVAAGSGQVVVADGEVTLSSGGSVFPVVTSIEDVFPPGDFVVRVGMRYLSQAVCGTGFGAMDNFWENYRGDPVCRPFLIWQDGGGVHVYSGSASNTVLGPAPDTAPHVFEWAYMDGRYDFVMDGVARSSGMCGVRPTRIFFGHPHPINCTPWTSFAIDFIEILPTGATRTSIASWARLKALYR